MNKKVFLLLSALLLAVLLCSICTFAADAATVYVKDGGTGNGSSARSPVGTMDAAATALGGAGGEIIVCGNLTISEKTTIPEQSANLKISATNGAKLLLKNRLQFAKNTNDNVITINLPIDVAVNYACYMFGGFNSITFDSKAKVTHSGGTSASLCFFGGVHAGEVENTDGCITTLPYTITVKAGTFNRFTGGNLRQDIDNFVGSIAAPITINISGGTFGVSGTYKTGSNHKNENTFNVSGMSILASDATLNISGGTFNAPVYVQGRKATVRADACAKSKRTASSKTYYAMDGNIAVNISGGTFNGGVVSAYYVQAAYNQVMRGNYTVTVTGTPTFSKTTLFDATQVKAYEGGTQVATLTYPSTLTNIKPKRFDVVNGANQTYTEPLRVIFIGDSITEGYAATDAGVNRMLDSYPTNFLELAEAAGKEVIVSNFGVAAAGLTQSLTRCYTDMLAWKLARDESDPDYVFFAIGTNDASDAGGTNGALMQYEDTLYNMAKTMGDKPDTEKVFMTNAIYRNTSSIVADLRASAVIHPVQERVIKTLAETDANKYVFVDMYGLTLSAASNDSLFKADNGTIYERLHPTQTGLALMGKVCYNAAFSGTTAPSSSYKRTSIYVSDSGTDFGTGTSGSPCSSLPVAFDKIALGSTVTIYISGTVTVDGNFYLPIGAKKINVVGSGTGAKLVCSGDSFKLGSDVSFKNLTLSSTREGGTSIMACFNDVEIASSVKFSGTWSFYAGYNVFADADPTTTATFDTVESASSDNDCKIVLNSGTFLNFMLGNRRFNSKAPYGTYSGNMTVEIGSGVTLTGTPDYRGYNGHNYLTGSINAFVSQSFSAKKIAEYAPTGTISGFTYDATKHTGTVTIEADPALTTTLICTGAADPWLFKHGDYFYLVTTGSSLVGVRRASTVAGLASASMTHVYNSAKDPTVTATFGKGAQLHGLWAPEIHYISEEYAPGNSGWYLYVSQRPNENDSEDLRMIVLKSTTDSPMGPYGHPLTGVKNHSQPILKSNGSAYTDWGIDQNLLFIPEGPYKGMYDLWVSEVGRGQSGANGAYHQTIMISKMQNPWTLSSEMNVITTPTQTWEFDGGAAATPRVVEGPTAVYGKQGDIYIIYSGSGYWVGYGLGQLTWTGGDPVKASSWKKLSDSGDFPNPIFSSRDSSVTYLEGLGHASFFTDESGEGFVCYHAYPVVNGTKGDGRNAYVEPYYIDYSLDSGVADTGVLVLGRRKNRTPTPPATATSVVYTIPLETEGEVPSLQPATIKAIPGGSITLRLSAAGAESYLVYRKSEDDKTFVLLGETTGTNYIDRDVIPNAIYSYRVYACRNEEIAGVSETVKVTVEKRTLWDVLLVLRYIAGDTAAISKDKADIDGDGSVSLADVLFTLKSSLNG